MYNKTFTETYGTSLHHVKSDTALVALVLLAYGCPTQAIVHAYDLDERTVGDWLWRAGQHGYLISVSGRRQAGNWFMCGQRGAARA